MKRSLLAIIIILSLVFTGCSNNSDAAIRSTYANYGNALLNLDGDEAVKYVAASTIEYYGQMNDIALTGSESDVKALPVMDKMLVLTLRHMADPQLLSAMTADEMFSYAVNERIINEKSVTDSEIGTIIVMSDEAYATIVINGQESPMDVFTFKMESDQWKIDLLTVIALGNAELILALESEGIDEDEFIFSALEGASGEVPSEDLWQPIVVD
jgi:hypothetical protein